PLPCERFVGAHMKTLDLTTLDLRDALDLAVLVETEARERYEELAAQMETHHTEETARFFRSMAENEARHGGELEARRRKLFGDTPRRLDASALFEVEAPEYERVRAFMTLREALDVAKAAEEKAHRFFTAGLALPLPSSVRSLFVELQGEEIRHLWLVEREREKLPPEDVVAPEEFADEPVSQ